jgi:hypothetical protein
MIFSCNNIFALIDANMLHAASNQQSFPYKARFDAGNNDLRPENTNLWEINYEISHS